MKKIICLIESLGSGGAERQLTGLAVMLKQQGYDVEVWYYAPKHFYSKDLDKAGVKYRFLENAQNKYKRIGFIRHELLCTKPDTVITYLDTPSIIGCITKITGGKFNLIVSERNTTQHLGFRDKIKFYLYRFANHIVPNSYSQARFIENNYPNLTSKIKCITNFVDTDKFRPTNKKEIHNKIRILTVARIMPQKNVINYLDAIKIVIDKGFNNFNIKWIGESLGDSYYNACVNKIKALNLSEYFTFEEQSSNIIEEYQESDIFCLPSIYEGFPNVVCEAMSCGLPVLCSDVCDNSDIVTNNINGLLFNPLDPNDIAEKIIIALEYNHDKTQAISSDNRHKAITNLSKDRFTNSYIELL